MISLCSTLLPNDKVHAIPADIGKIFKPIPGIDRIIEVDVSPIKTIVSSDSKIVFRVFLIFLFLFDYMIFVFEVGIHFFNVVDMVIKTVNII